MALIHNVVQLSLQTVSKSFPLPQTETLHTLSSNPPTPPQHLVNPNLLYAPINLAVLAISYKKNTMMFVLLHLAYFT